MTEREVDLLSEEGAKEVLRQMIAELDLLDEENLFGLKGWRHRFGMEEF